jgi:hypothetical protein
MARSRSTDVDQPLLWLPACLIFFPLWVTLQAMSGRQGDAPSATLDEFDRYSNAIARDRLV